MKEMEKVSEQNIIRFGYCTTVQNKLIKTKN